MSTLTPLSRTWQHSNSRRVTRRWAGASRSASAKRPSRLRLLNLEARVTPASATLGSGILTIDYTQSGIVAEAVTVFNDGANIILSGDVAGSLSNPAGSVTKIVVTDSGGSTAQSLTWTGAAYTLSGGLDSTGVELVMVNAPVTATGTAVVNIVGQTVTTTEAMTTSGGTISLKATGDITLKAGIISNGGVQTLTADSDGDGSGTFTLDMPIVEFVDPNPAIGNGFGTTVVVLTSGNVVVTSPGDDLNGSDSGAVYLFNGGTGALISALLGTTALDQIGSGGVTALTNGNYVISSLFWDNFAAADAGAVTWGNGVTGVSGVVSAANSLVGSITNDVVGSVTALANGNYVVRSPNWDNGIRTDAGAVTWGNGSTGVIGNVSSANSLVGGQSTDSVGSGGVTALTNGNYVIRSQSWNNGAASGAGAVTWGNGATGVVDVVSATNSLVGSTGNDSVGSGGVTALANGNYVVRSPIWNNGAATDAGAVTWGNGATGVTGLVSAANSLVGTTGNDSVGSGGVTALTNGNYVVSSQLWDNGAATDAGAVTWGTGTTGIIGVVSATNSLVGGTANNNVGNGGVTALTNGSYLAISTEWDNGAATNAGAVTWGNGATGVIGMVSAANSLVGGTANNNVGNTGVVELTNGNYVVRSSGWDNGAATNAGAVTWGNGTTGISGVVSAANSLVGSTGSDSVGVGGVFALTNGNYVIRSQQWDNGAITNAGAATWGNGTTGISGVVSATNSLVGSTANDSVGNTGVTVLTNGNYVVRSSGWDNGAATNAGAVTWGNGAIGISGVVSAANSLVGGTTNDSVGISDVTALTNGNYVVRSQQWSNGAAIGAGAVTWGNGATGVVGVVSVANSLVGSTTNDSLGNFGVTALTNGNYVVTSLLWDNGAALDAGAITWGNGTTGISGVVSATNSLVGSTGNDSVGSGGVTAFANGNYVVRSQHWDNGPAANAAAVTWGSGTSGVSGTISPANSAIGSVAGSGLVSATGTNGVSSHFYARFVSDGGGRVRIGSQSSGFAFTSGVTASGGAVTIAAADAKVEATVSSTTTVTFTTSPVNRPINLGTNAAGSMGLTDAELDLVVTNTLRIGDGNSGTITVSSDITRPAFAAMELISGGDVVISGGSINTGGGTLLLDPGTSPAAVKPTLGGVDATVGTVSFDGGLNIAIAGAAVDTQYSQLNVVGGVNLSGASLLLSGAYVPAEGDAFVIVSAGSVTGTFIGLADGSTIAFNGRTLKIAYSATEVTLADATPPSVSSITRIGGSPTKAGSVQFTVTFSEPVSGVDAGDFALTTTGLTGATITSVTPAGPASVYTVTVGSYVSNGSVRLDVVDDDSITNGGGDKLGGAGAGNGNFTTGETTVIDITAPTVTVVASAAVINDFLIGPGAFKLTATFNEPMNPSFTPTFSFPVENPGLTLGLASAGWTSATVYEAIYNTLDLNMLRLNVDVQISGGQDAAGNAHAQTDQADVFTIDTRNPIVVAMSRLDPASTNGATVRWSVTFSEPVTGIVADTFTLFNGGLGGSPAITEVTGGGTTWTVKASTGSGEGPLALYVTDADGVTDAAGNPLAALPIAGPSYAVDHVAPQAAKVTTNTLVVTDADVGPAGFQVTIAYNEPMYQSIAPVVSFPVENPAPTLTAAGGTWLDAKTYRVTYSVVDFGATLKDIDITVSGGQDAVGNPQPPLTISDLFDIQMANPATVSSISINGGATQRSRVTTMAITFDQNVGTPLASAFQLQNQKSLLIPTLSAAVDNSGPTTIVNLTFLAGDAVEFGSLADGRYTLTIAAGSVNGGNFDGNSDGTAGDDYTLIGSPANGLFRLFGDADGSGQVTSSDFLAFRLAFLSPSTAFDYNGNGTVDSGDFLEFRLRFLQVI